MDPRKYPAARVALLYIGGILISTIFRLPYTMLAWSYGVLFGTSVILFFASRRSGRCQWCVQYLAVILCITMGAGRFTLDTSDAVAERQFRSDTPAVLRGVIIEASGSSENRVRCVVAGEALFRDSVWRPISSNVLVNVKKTRIDTPLTEVRYGMKVECRGVLSFPPEQRNPGEFNMRRYYEAIGISYLMLVRGFGNVSVLDSTAGEWHMRTIVQPARNGILRLIGSTLKGQEGEFLKGILIGERGGISLANRTAFANAGVAHVLAVSGSNVAFVAAVFLGVLQFLRISKLFRIVATSLGLILFMFITGNQAPVVRATVMALVFLLGSLAQEKPNPYNSLGLATLMILMADARQLYDVGFQLSFVAALSIIHFYPILNRLIGHVSAPTRTGRAIVWILRVCAVSVAAMAGTVPITAVYFGKVSVIGLLANIVVVPLVGASVVMGCVSIAGGVVSLWLAEVLAAANFALLRATLIITDVAGGLPFATIDTYLFRPVYALPYYCGLVLVFHINEGFVARRFFIAFLGALDIAAVSHLVDMSGGIPARLRVSFIDVGQGDAVLAEFPNGRTMLIDAGPASGEYDAGERTVVPFLKRSGITAIDLLVISHPDADHIGGVPGVLKNFCVKEVVDNGVASRSDIYSSYVSGVRRQRVNPVPGRAGCVLEIDEGSRLYVLSPGAGVAEPDTSFAEVSMNAASVVVKLQQGNIAFLFAGDADREAEEVMTRVYGDFLKSTVLKVGHHGSRTSSSRFFLEYVEPEYAVISVGKNNRFNHPSQDVLERLDGLHADVIRTDEEGAVVLETDGTSVRRVGWR